MAKKASSAHGPSKAKPDRERTGFEVTFDENPLLRACARGEISADDAFERLYLEYGRIVSAWLSFRVDRVHVDDLSQDVWLIFYSRFRQWAFGTERESSEARPVLSFLFRTASFVARGHRRLAAVRLRDPERDTSEQPAPRGAREIQRAAEAERCLALAERACSEDELEVLSGKLVGLSARDIATGLGITEAVVDHRYRTALERLRGQLGVDEPARRRTRRA